MSTNKLVTLAHLRSLAERVKSEDAALAAKLEALIETVEGLVSTGGEANILEGVKVNGAALPITDKMIDILIEIGSENGTISVNGAAVAIKGLAALAYKSEISEEDLSEALLASIAAKATQADLTALEVRVTDAEGRITVLESAGFQTAEQVQAAIAAASHLKYAVADAVPSAEEADANTWYLVKNEETGHYDIYGLIEDEVRIIDDTTIDLTGYTTTDAMKAWVAQEIAALNIDQYATDAEMASALERIGALESALDNYYTKSETEEYVGNQLQMFRDTVIDGMVNDITALGNRVTALEEGMDGYATDEEAAAAGASAAADAIAANTASDDDVNAMLDEEFGSDAEG